VGRSVAVHRSGRLVYRELWRDVRSSFRRRHRRRTPSAHHPTCWHRSLPNCCSCCSRNQQPSPPLQPGRPALRPHLLSRRRARCGGAHGLRRHHDARAAARHSGQRRLHARDAAAAPGVERGAGGAAAVRAPHGVHDVCVTRRENQRVDGHDGGAAAGAAAVLSLPLLSAAVTTNAIFSCTRYHSLLIWSGKTRCPAPNAIDFATEAAAHALPPLHPYTVQLRSMLRGTAPSPSLLTIAAAFAAAGAVVAWQVAAVEASTFSSPCLLSLALPRRFSSAANYNSVRARAHRD
jgi:hypothetical protein